MPPQFVGIQDSGEHRTSREGAQGGVNLRCAAAGEAGTFEGEKRSDGFWVAGHTKQLARHEAGSTLQEQVPGRSTPPGSRFGTRSNQGSSAAETRPSASSG